MPAACLSALFCPLVIGPFIAPLAIGTGDMLNLFLFGAPQFGLGLVFPTLGGQLVSATENALIGTPEHILLSRGSGSASVKRPSSVLPVALSSWWPSPRMIQSRLLNSRERPGLPPATSLTHAAPPARTACTALHMQIG